jgi:hypothetical protein
MQMQNPSHPGEIIREDCLVRSSALLAQSLALPFRQASASRSPHALVAACQRPRLRGGEPVKKML